MTVMGVRAGVGDGVVQAVVKIRMRGRSFFVMGGEIERLRD
jgi:hypothetical protein